MQQFLIENWLNLLFGLLSAGILTYLKHFKKIMINYKSFLSEQDEKRIRTIIQEELRPISDELLLEQKKLEAIKMDYKTKLVTACEIYLERGYITTKEFASLTELWKIYHEGLGGECESDDFYNRTCKLPIHEEEKKTKKNEKGNN